MSEYRGHRVEVGPEGTDLPRIVWVVFCDPSVWSTGVLMDGAVYVAGTTPEAATARAWAAARKLVDDYLDHGISPRPPRAKT